MRLKNLFFAFLITWAALNVACDFEKLKEPGVYILSTHGEVLYSTSDKPNLMKPIEVGLALSNKETIITKDGDVDVRTPFGVIIKIENNSAVSFRFSADKNNINHTDMFIGYGSVFVKAQPKDKNFFFIKASNAALKFQKADLYLYTVPSNLKLKVFDGAVELYNKNDRSFKTVNKHQAIAILLQSLTGYNEVYDFIPSIHEELTFSTMDAILNNLDLKTIEQQQEESFNEFYEQLSKQFALQQKKASRAQRQINSNKYLLKEQIMAQYAQNSNNILLKNGEHIEGVIVAHSDYGIIVHGIDNSMKKIPLKEISNI